MYVFIVRRMSLCRMSFWATPGETPLQAKRVAKVCGRLWMSTVRPWASFLGMLAALRSASRTRLKSEFEGHDTELDENRLPAWRPNAGS